MAPNSLLNFPYKCNPPNRRDSCPAYVVKRSSSPSNIIQPPQAKEKALQVIYEYLTQYFAPKPHQRGSSQADSGESQEQSADHDGADLSPGVAGGEGDEHQIDCDPYDVDPPNGDNQALVESQERLCWSLGGEVRKTPNEDFESLALASPEPPKLELPVTWYSKGLPSCSN